MSTAFDPPVPQDPDADRNVMPAPPTASAPTYSSDGMWYWNGQQWTPVQTTAQTSPFPVVDQPARGQGMAVASLVLGILSPIFAFTPVMGWFFVPLPIVGLVLGVLGLRSPGRGKAIAGVVLSLCALALDAFWLLVFIFGVVTQSARP